MAKQNIQVVCKQPDQTPHCQRSVGISSGFYPFPLLLMDTSKTVLGAERSLIGLAYQPHRQPKWQRKEQSLPGPLFDVITLGLFLFLGIALVF